MLFEQLVGGPGVTGLIVDPRSAGLAVVFVPPR